MSDVGVLEAADAEGVACALRARLREARISIVDLLSHFDKRSPAEKAVDRTNFEITLSDFVSTMKGRFGFRVKRRILKSIFEELDLDNSGQISHAELFQFVFGRTQHVLGGAHREAQRSRDRVFEALRAAWLRCKSQPPPSSSLAPSDAAERQGDGHEAMPEVEAEAADRGSECWSVEGLREQLQALLAASGLADVDLLRACDNDNSGGVERKEWLRCMKRIFVGGPAVRGGARQPFVSADVQFWDEAIRDAVLASHDHCRNELGSRAVPCEVRAPRVTLVLLRGPRSSPPVPVSHEGKGGKGRGREGKGGEGRGSPARGSGNSSPRLLADCASRVALCTI